MRQAERQLQLDVGNSAIKWRLIERTELADELVDGQALAAGRLRLAELATLGKTLAKFGALGSVVVSSVAVDSANPLIEQFCRQSRFPPPIFAQVHDGKSGLRCGYSDPAKLGIDRWLAMLAARARFSGALVVVDLGSAATFDVLDGIGQHLGGYILPGLKLAREALAQGTESVKVELLDDGQAGLGINTAQAVNRGVLAAWVALAENLAKRHNATIVVGGGDAEVLCGLLEQGEYYPDMVLDGLDIAVGEGK